MNKIRGYLAGFRLENLKKTNRLEYIHFSERMILRLILKGSGWGEGGVDWITSDKDRYCTGG
jgi:hypothetical protein